MDTDITISSASNQLTKLTPADKLELRRFLENQEQVLKLNQTTQSLTKTCWTKCMAGNKMNSSTLSSSEEGCLRNCVERFMDGTNAILQHVKKLQQAAGQQS